MSFESKIIIEHLTLKEKKANKVILDDISLSIPINCITALIGPSGSGKTSLLKCINRMIDLDASLSMEGKIYSQDLEVTAAYANTYDIRRKFSLVLTLPTPLPKSIYENIAIAAKLVGIKKRNEQEVVVERCLKEVALWDEIKDRLNESAYQLSGGQQQRLCIARALALNSEVIMFDESTSGLDPISTTEVEETVGLLKQNATIIWVTNNVKQAGRLSDYTAFLLMGKLIEFNRTSSVFIHPNNKQTEEYISGKFG